MTFLVKARMIDLGLECYLDPEITLNERYEVLDGYTHRWCFEWKVGWEDQVKVVCAALIRTIGLCVSS